MDAIRSFNRFELKYLVPTETIPKLQSEFKKYMVSDSNGDQFGNYALSSLYFDTDDYKFYREKIEGLKYRRKLRMRAYETGEPLTDDSTVFLEIKQRVDRVTQKRRFPLTYKEALEFCNELKIPKHDARDALVVNEIYQMLLDDRLYPSCITSYFRQAWHGTEYDPGLRITIDTNIRERTKDLDLDSKKIGSYMVTPDRSIMEIKANDSIPIWISEIIAQYNFRLIRISKYCQGLETGDKVAKTVYNIF